jgi:hypothetical protein
MAYTFWFKRGEYEQARLEPVVGSSSALRLYYSSYSKKVVEYLSPNLLRAKLSLPGINVINLSSWSFNVPTSLSEKVKLYLIFEYDFEEVAPIPEPDKLIPLSKKTKKGSYGWNYYGQSLSEHSWHYHDPAPTMVSKYSKGEAQAVSDLLKNMMKKAK